MRCVLALNGLSEIVSFTEDDQTEWNGKWNKDVVYYDIGFPDLPLITPKKLKRALNLAMTTWDLEIPIKFKPANWHGVSADIRISFAGDEDNLFRTRPSVLAYAYFPEQGDLSGVIVFNNKYLWDLSGAGISGKEAVEKGIVENAHPDSIIRTYNLIVVLTHELGHSLGLKHDVTGNNNGEDAMDAFYDEGVIDLSGRDISRITDKYGVREYSRWSHYGRFKKWLARAKRRF